MNEEEFEKWNEKMFEKHVLATFIRQFVPKIDRTLSEHHVKNFSKNLPEAFPEYPEIVNKPVRAFVQDFPLHVLPRYLSSGQIKPCC